MRKWLCLLILACLLLCACGKENVPETESATTEVETTQTVETKQTETETVTETTTAEVISQETETTEAEPISVKEAEHLGILVTRVMDWNYDDTYEMITTNVSYDQIHLSERSQKYEGLEKAFVALNQAAEKTIHEFQDGSADEMLESEETRQFLPFYEHARVYVKRADDRFVSLLLTDTSYAGGMHEFKAWSGYVYDTQSGKQLTLDDVFTSRSLLVQLLQEELLANYDEDLFFMDHIDESVEEYLEESASFTLDPDGATFYFNPYELGPYASGAFEVKLYYDKYPKAFVRNDFASAGDYTIQVAEDEALRFRDGSGKEKCLEVYGTPGVDMYDQTELTLMLDDVAVKTGQYGYSSESYLMHTNDGKNSLVCCITMDNDYGMIYVFDLDGARPELVCTVDGAHFDRMETDEQMDGMLPTDPEKFALLRRCDLLSTYSYREPVGLQDGKIVSQGKVFEIVRYQEEPLVLKQEMSFSVVNENYQETTKEVFTKGTKLVFDKTNGVNLVYFTLEDGRKVQVQVTATDWPMRVNGIDAEDVFEQMFFAG